MRRTIGIGTIAVSAMLAACGGSTVTEGSGGGSSATSSTTTTSTGGGGGTTCEAPLVDCQGACVDTATDTAHCGSCGVACSAGEACSGGHCVAPACTDAVKNGSETDVDCGGTCGPCDDGEHCSAAADCKSLVCMGGACVASTCTDAVKNGSETDVDCGGTCGPCDDGEHCSAAADCKSLVCMGGACVASTCTDAVKNGSETDVDCGGSCPACDLGQYCNANTDCASAGCCSNVCLDLGTDLNNCGGCGVTCAAGGNATAVCAMGACTVICPMGFRDCDGDPANGCETNGACQPVQLANEGSSADAITVDDTNIYWVVRFPGVIYSAPKAGGAPTALYTNQSGAVGISHDDKNLYWTLYQGGNTVLSGPKAGGQGPTVLSTIGGNPAAIDVYQGDVYFTDFWGDALYKVPTSGGQTTVVAQGLPGRNGGLLIDGNGFHASSANTNSLYFQPFGGQSTTLAGGLAYAMQIARDATYFYVSAAGGPAVYRVPVGGGAAEPIVECNGCEGVAVDDKFVYYTNFYTGDVKRIAK